METPAEAPSSPAGVGLDPLAADDGAELRRRVRASPVHRVARADLDGHVGLSSRALHELGVTLAPVGIRDVPAAVVGRLQVAVGVLIAGAFLGIALSPILEGLFGLIGGPLANDDRDRLDSGFALSAFFGLAGWGGLVVLGRGVRRVRAGRAERRRGPGAGTDPAVDPQARPTVAVVREPHGLRVSLLWLRGDPVDARLLEVRTIAEERIAADDPGGAEDVVERYAGVVIRADAARGLPAPAQDASPRSGAAALVAAAETELPSVDPAVPVRDGWDPEPLTDEGRAELAARLVRSRPLLWNPAELERLAVDPARPLDHRPGRWPSEDVRRAPLPSGRRPVLVAAAWTAGVVWMVAAGSLEKAAPSEVDGRRTTAWIALAIGVALVSFLLVSRRRAPGRRLLRDVRRAARSQPAALERGVPDGAGRVLVLHGLRDGVDRLELVHVRPAPGDGSARRMQVRTLAWWERSPGSVLEAREVGQDLWRIADDAGFVATRAAADARGVERLNTGLARATDRPVRIRTRAEPLAWGAWAFALFLAIMVLGTTLSDDPLSRGGGIALAVITWPAMTAWLFRRSARRVLDPVD